MAVGAQLNSGTVDIALTNFSVQFRNLFQAVTNLNTEVNFNGQGQANLEAAGYNPTDAASALTFLAYLSQIAQVYYGELQSGGTGGTGAVAFDFNNALSALWAGQ